MPAGPAARASQARILICACGRAGERAVDGKHLERERLQSIAGKDCGRLIELPMRGRAAAPQVIVIHRGQIVVHERVGVDQLDGGCERIERRFVGADELATRIDEQRPYALPAAQHGIAHGGEQSLGNLMVGAENGGEFLIDSAAVAIETLCERLRRGPCYHRGPS